MATLYELKNDWLTLYDMMSDDNSDEEIIKDTMEALEGEIESKADGYAMVRAQLRADAEAIKFEEARLACRRKSIENNIKRLEGSLMDAMELTGKTKFKTTLFSYGIQNNPVSVVIDDETQIPELFLIPQPPKVDKAGIKDILKHSGNTSFAHLEQTKSLRIR